MEKRERGTHFFNGQNARHSLCSTHTQPLASLSVPFFARQRLSQSCRGGGGASLLPPSSSVRQTAKSRAVMIPPSNRLQVPTRFLKIRNDESVKSRNCDIHTKLRYFTVNRVSDFHCDRGPSRAWCQILEPDQYRARAPERRPPPPRPRRSRATSWQPMLTKLAGKAPKDILSNF